MRKWLKISLFRKKRTFPWCCQYHAKATNGHSIQKHSQHSQSVRGLHESVNFSTVEEERIRASTSSNVSISLLMDAKYRLIIDCVFEKNGTIKVCAYIQYFFRLLLYSNCMDDNNNKYRKKSVQGIISFHEYIIIMNIGQSILITERVSLFF